MKQVGKGRGIPVDIDDPWAGESLFDHKVDKALRKGSKSSHSGGYVKCAHSHPPLVIKGLDGTEYSVHGGSASTPLLQTHDIYVALDWGVSHDPKAYPWYGTRQFISYPIDDMRTPKDPVDFKLMIKWLAEQIVAGKNVHVGCIGGHGRTGMVLAALVAVISGDVDAITYTREHYCHKAVETDSQVAWLVKHFGVKSVAGTKQWSTGGNNGWGNTITTYTSAAVTGRWPSNSGVTHEGNVPRSGKTYKPEWPQTVEVRPFKVQGNIWGVTELPA